MSGTYSLPSAPGTPGGPARCRRCGARIGRGDTWCSLCLAPTALDDDPAADEAVDRPAAAPVSAPVSRVPRARAPQAGEVEVQESVAQESVARDPQAPAATDRDPAGATNPAEDDRAAQKRTEQMLAGLAEQEHGSGDPSTLSVARAHLALAELPGSRSALAFGGALVLLVVLMGGLTLLGMLI